ncbi:hypothetical protein A7C99_6608 [Trichophyton rubrum]|uniref:Uncharacterized protein n=1 Tax=Trichophyton rubrum TaxID=5551 RepID=A0A178ERR9_TRIRU|nr:hypothetical protein A7C99_6608 [Trichophyton rubrum]
MLELALPGGRQQQRWMLDAGCWSPVACELMPLVTVTGQDRAVFHGFHWPSDADVWRHRIIDGQPLPSKHAHD